MLSPRDSGMGPTQERLPPAATTGGFKQRAALVAVELEHPRITARIQRAPVTIEQR